MASVATTRRLVPVAVTVVAALAGCGGGGSVSVRPGHASPGAAVVGFLLAVGRHDAKAACSYVVPSQAAGCVQGLAAGSPITVTNLAVGSTEIRGPRALVSITGKLCVTAAGVAQCRSNSNPSAGQPSATTSAAFDHAYAQNHTTTGTPAALPCSDVGGRWYVNLDA